MTAVRVRPIRETRPPESTRSHAELMATREPSAYVQGSLAVDFTPEPAEDTFFAAQPTLPADLPAIEPWAAQIGKAAVEVMAGQRGPAQLLRWTTPDVYNVLAHHHAVASRRAAEGMLRKPPTRPAVVRRVLVCTPAASVAEVTVIVVHGGRVRALALRFVGEDGRWRLKAFRTA